MSIVDIIIDEHSINIDFNNKKLTFDYKFKLQNA